MLSLINDLQLASNIYIVGVGWGTVKVETNWPSVKVDYNPVKMSLVNTQSSKDVSTLSSSEEVGREFACYNVKTIQLLCKLTKPALVSC